MRKVFLFLTIALFSLCFQLHAQNSSPYWSLAGNSNTNSSSRLGTTNSKPLLFYTDNKQRMQVDDDGRVIVGGSSSSNSALFQVTSTTRGVLIPRMTQAQRNAIASPAQGLLVYQKDAPSGFYYYDGGWHSLTPSSPSGFANTALSNLVPTSINQDLVPDADNTRSLGSSSMGWKDLYLDGVVYLNAQPFLSGPGDNTFTGKAAGSSNTGTGNIANGYQALYNNTSGNNNAAVGYQVLFTNTTGSGNAAHGYQALYTNTSGFNNAAVGYQALYSNTSGFNNAAQGSYSLFSNNTGYYNTAQGYTSLYNNTTGNNNTALGSSALYSNTTGTDNTVVGATALYSITTGLYNTAVGSQALYSNISGNNNAAYGYQALYNSTGTSNTAQGSYSLFSNTTGDNNTALGAYCLYSNTTGYANVAQGYNALYNNTTGSTNTAQGYYVLHNNTTGDGNTALGTVAMNNNTTGAFNTVVGEQALYSNTTGNTNTALGLNSLFFNTTSSYNTGVGYYSGINCSTCTTATFLGTGSGTTDGLDNVTAVGNGATTTAPSTVELGNAYVVAVMSSGTFVTTSDGRFKRDLKEEVPGLEFINKLRPVTYHYKIHELNSFIKQGTKTVQSQAGGALQGMEAPKVDEGVTAAAKAKEEEGIKAKEAIKYTGFVAQEVEAAAKEVNYDFSGVHKPSSSKDVYGLSYADFVVPLVKAVQELDSENKAKDGRITKLETQMAELRQMVLDMKNGTNTVTSMGVLNQPVPNPASGTTRISYTLPTGTAYAQLLVTDAVGKTIQEIQLNGSGSVNVNTTSLSSGVYNYTLVVAGKQVDTKRLVIAR